MTITFADYTMYFSEDMTDHYFDDCPNEDAFKEEAKLSMSEKLKRDISDGRQHIRRLKMSDEEFLAVVGIMFYTTEGLDVSEEVTHASQAYKDTILKELHTYYRDELQMNDYAVCLGEILMLLQYYEQRSVGMKEHFEVLRMLNIFTDETLMYRLS
ncbi:hypothetical protein PENTCL1PPCAC_14586, partial [Pristionchus entomophagus]